MLIRTVRRVPVITPVPADEPALDLRVHDGRVVEVGVALRRQPGEQEVLGEGRWVMPGLWDQHVHLAQWAQTALRLDLSGTGSPTEVTARVAAALPDRPGSGVVFGFGHRSATWPRPATVAELDAVTGQRPVVLISGDAHNGWLNSAALRLLGLPHTDQALDENDWFAVFPRLADLPADAEADRRAYADAVHRAQARGVVGVVDFEFERGFERWPERVAAGLDSLRVRTAVYPDDLDAALTAGLRTGDPIAGLVEMGPLKIISDGSLNTRTAFCCEPYTDAPGSRGVQNYTGDDLVDLLGRARVGGLRAAVHAIGDAAVGIALDAFERTGTGGSIEHAQLMRWADIERMARLGLTASVQPAHLLDDRDVSERCWHDRTDRCFPLASLVRAGVPLALGSDAPVSPLDPWLAIRAAVTRTGDGRGPWHPEQALSLQQALAASTDGQASVDVGSRADLVLLDDLALSLDPTVACTIVAGSVVTPHADGAGAFT